MPRRRWSWSKVILWGGVAGFLGGFFLPGCGTYVPRKRLADCAQLTRNLREEIDLQRDQLVATRAELEDARWRDRESLQEFETLQARNAVLESRLAEYQQDREQMAQALEQIRRDLGVETRTEPVQRVSDPSQRLGRADR